MQPHSNTGKRTLRGWRPTPYLQRQVFSGYTKILHKEGRKRAITWQRWKFEKNEKSKFGTYDSLKVGAEKRIVVQRKIEASLLLSSRNSRRRNRSTRIATTFLWQMNGSRNQRQFSRFYDIYIGITTRPQWVGWLTADPIRWASKNKRQTPENSFKRKLRVDTKIIGELQG